MWLGYLIDSVYHSLPFTSTTEHFGQLDQTIFTTEKKEGRIYSELGPDSDPVDGNWDVGMFSGVVGVSD